MTDADDAQKTEQRREIKARIEQLDALYDVEMVKYLDLNRRINRAQKIGAGDDKDTHSMERELALVQKTRRNIGDQSSYARQELRDVDGPTLEEEYELYLAANLSDKAKATKSPKKMKSVPPAAFKNQQIDLFRDLLANTDKEREGLSNAIDLWDNVPRYALSRGKQDKSRLEGGFLPLAELNFQYKGNPYTAQIRPARIELKNKRGELTGETAEFYPSTREELVEHALRKLATEQQFGFLDTDNSRSGVTFTLHQLRTELADRGRWMKYAEIVESLDIMNLSNIRLIDKGTDKKDPSLMSQPYLPTLIKVSKEGLASDPGAKWLVQFHSALTQSIAQLTYRQFNYHRLMSCQSQISRWLISQLVLKYTYAAPGNTFSMLYSTIQRDSGLLNNYKRIRDAVDALDEAFEELKREGVLMTIKKDAKTGARGKIEDVNYTLATSVKFASEQRASNKRQSTSSAVLGIVDNSA